MNLGNEYNDMVSIFNICWHRNDEADITESDAKQLKEFSTDTIVQGIREDLHEGDMETYLTIDNEQVQFHGCWNC